MATSEPRPCLRQGTGAVRRPGLGQANGQPPTIVCCKSRLRTYRTQGPTLARPSIGPTQTPALPSCALDRRWPGSDMTFKHLHGSRWRGTVADRNPDMQFETAAPNSAGRDSGAASRSGRKSGGRRRPVQRGCSCVWRGGDRLFPVARHQQRRSAPVGSGRPARQPAPQDLADGGMGHAQHLAPGRDDFQHRERPVLGGFGDREAVYPRRQSAKPTPRGAHWSHCTCFTPPVVGTRMPGAEPWLAQRH